MLRLRHKEFDDDQQLVMAIVNRTPDSFYDRGATWDDEPAFDRVRQVVAEGAEIVDIGGGKAAPRGAVAGAGGVRRPAGGGPAGRAGEPPRARSGGAPGARGAR